MAKDPYKKNDALVILFVLFISCSGAFGWVWNIVHCIIHAKFLMLLLGVFIPPIGIIHGWLAFLGEV